MKKITRTIASTAHKGGSAHDMRKVMKRVDAQVGRAVTRLSDR